MTPRRLLIVCVLVAAVLAAASPAGAQCLYPPCDFVLDNSITVNHPSSATKCDTIEVVLMPSEGYEVTILYTTGLQYVRGWHEKCGWGAGPCDVGLTAYEWSLSYYGPIHYVFIVNGTDQATFRVDFAKGSWSGTTAYRTDTTTMAILPGDPSLNIGVTASPVKIPADGTSTSAVTVQCRTGNCAPANGRQVSLTTTLGSLGAGGATAVGLVTDSNGQATATLTAATTPGQATLSAAAEGRTATATVAMSGASLDLETSEDALPATGTADAMNRALVTATLKDESGNPLPGKTVTFTTSLGALSSNHEDPATTVTAVTSDDGQAMVELRSSDVPGTATIAASYDTLTATTTVQMVAVDVTLETVLVNYESLPSQTFNQTQEVTLYPASAMATKYGTTRVEYRADFSWKKPGQAAPEPLHDYLVHISSTPEPVGTHILSTTLASDDTFVCMFPCNADLRTDGNGSLDLELRVEDFWRDTVSIEHFAFDLQVSLPDNPAVHAVTSLDVVDNQYALYSRLYDMVNIPAPVVHDDFWERLAFETRLQEDLRELRSLVTFEDLGGFVNDYLLEPWFDWVSDQYLDRQGLLDSTAFEWQAEMVRLLLQWHSERLHLLNGLDYAPISLKYAPMSAVVIYPRKTTGQTEWLDDEARIADGWIEQHVVFFSSWKRWVAEFNRGLSETNGFLEGASPEWTDRKGIIVDSETFFPANGRDYPTAVPEDTYPPFAPETTASADCPVWMSVVDSSGQRNGYDPNAAPGTVMLRTDMPTLWWTTLTMADGTSAWDFVLPEGKATVELHAYGAGGAVLKLGSRRLGKTLTYQGMTVTTGDHATLAFDPAFPAWPELVFDDGRIISPVVASFGLPGVSPDEGRPSGGTEIRITGVDVIAGAAVTVGGVPATDVRWLNGTTLAAVTGRAVRVGPADVVVTNPGAQPVTLAKGFTYETAKTLVDLNADGVSDIVFYKPESGRWAMTTADGQGGFGVSLGQWAAGWTIKGGDFDGDGATDLFFYNVDTGAWYVGLNDGQGQYTYLPGSWAAGWEVQVLDLTGDGRADAFVYNPGTGAWYQCLTTGPGTFAYHGGTWAPGWALVAAELNGDGVGDLFVYNRATGAWYRCVSDGMGGFGYVGGTWSPGWEIVAGDFDGDGLSDLLTYNAATGAWYRCRNTGADFTYTPGAWSAGWGLHVGDFTGDGRADVFVYDRQSGAWYVCVSTAAGAFAYHGGTWSAGWQVHVMELNGDGQSDLLVYDPATGAYYQCVTTGPGTFTYRAGQWDAGWTLITGVGR